ncbi:hypothetical protein GCM10023187_34460 [Nibrella viscosa]|uniref:Outer membrane protein beta-barrel domain-containing protein n=1 Tax=Nibrella viscosa TaxID=1084524 RepID=A0ABP8KMG9_9BACT
MQELSDEQMDELFRKSAEEFEPVFDPDHWLDMKRRLDNHDRGILWGQISRWATPVLLLLLLTGGYWYFRSPKANPSTDTPKLAGKVTPPPTRLLPSDSNHPAGEPSGKTGLSPARSNDVGYATAGPGKADNATTNAKAPDQPDAPGTQIPAGNRWPAPPGTSQRALNLTSLQRQRPIFRLASRDSNPEKDKSAGKQDIDPVAQDTHTTAGEPGHSAMPHEPAAPAVAADRPASPEAAAPEGSRLPMLSPMVPHAIRLPAPAPLSSQITDSDLPRPARPVVPAREKGASIQFLVSPDLTAIGLTDFDRPGTNVGMLLQYRLANRWSIQTGVLRSIKIYHASIEQYQWPSYYQWAVMPKGVAGRCNMIDIPVNIRYDFLLRRHPAQADIKSRWFVSSGITSYVMLRETYDYQYANPNDPQIRHRSWNGQTGSYRFSHLNVSLGYENQISRRLSWQVEPFIKVSLRPVGYFKARLLSTGAFVSLRYRL